VYARLLAERPSFAVERAVRGMIPKNRLGRQVMRKLSVYDGPSHPHAAQKPTSLAVGEVPPWTGLPAPKPHTPKRQREAPARAEEEVPAKATGGRKSSTRPSTAASDRRSTSTRSRAKSGAGRTSSGSGSKSGTTGSTRKKRTEKES
jgi:ribosomal L13-like protein